MSLSGVNRGAAAAGSPSTSLIFSPTSDLAAGSSACLYLGYDNAEASGGDPFVSITDSLGNTWTPRVAALNDPGAASAGCAMRCFTTDQDVGVITTATVITVSFGLVSVPVRTWALHEIIPDAGYTVVYVTGGSAIETTATPSITTGTITSGGLLIAGVARQGNETQTDDADTTNGSWSTGLKTATGTTTSGIELITQRKVVTATATQTYNPTYGGISDVGCDMWVWFTQNKNISVPVGAVSFSQAAPIPGAGVVVPAGSVALSLSLPTLVFSPFGGFISIPYLYLGGIGTPEVLILKPGPGQITLAGIAPSLWVPQLVAVPQVAVSISGQAPSILRASQFAPPSGAVSFTGLAPTATVDNPAGPGFVSAFYMYVGGTAHPITNYVVNPGPAAILVTGQAPVAASAGPGFLSFPYLGIGGIGALVNALTLPPAGSLPLTGYAPALQFTHYVGVPAGAVTATGYAPSTLLSSIIGSAAITLSTTTPIISMSANVVAFISRVNILLTGQLPVVMVSSQVYLSPAPASIRIYGREPSQPSNIVIVGSRSPLDSTLVGSKALVGGDDTAPDVIAVAASPSKGSVSLVGVAPRVVIGTVIGVAAGAISCTGRAPVAVASWVIVPTPAAVVFAGIPSTPLLNYIIVPGLGGISIAGPPPGYFVGLGFTPSSGALSLTGTSPTLLLSDYRYITPPSAVVQVAGQAPSAVYGSLLNVPAGLVALAGAAPFAAIDTPRAPSTGGVALQGQAPTFAVSIVIAVPPGSVTLDPQYPWFFYSGNHVFAPGTASISLSMKVPAAWWGAIFVIPDKDDELLSVEIVENLDEILPPVEQFIRLLR